MGTEQTVQATAYQGDDGNPPTFDPNSLKNDVGYLVLTTPVTLGPATQTIHIAGADEQGVWPPGQLVEISGWGSTIAGGDTVDTLRAASVPIVADSSCSATGVYGTFFDPATMVCAGKLSGGVDTCQGDSGGPLEAPLDDGAYRLVGITSWGFGCVPDPVLTIEQIAEGKFAKKAERRAKRSETRAAMPPQDQPKKNDAGPAKILRNLPMRRGHFVLESGYHTDLWLTLDALFVDWKMSLGWIRPLARRLKGYRLSAVCGPLVGGAFLAQSLARHSGLRFYYTERMQTPSTDGLFTAEYRLPAGQVQGASNERFAVVDDVISAGSSVRATVAALQSAGAKTVVVASLLVLGTAATDHFATLRVPLIALGKQEFNLWAPAECPLCREGIALEDPVGPNAP